MNLSWAKLPKTWMWTKIPHQTFLSPIDLEWVGTFGSSMMFKSWIVSSICLCLCKWIMSWSEVTGHGMQHLHLSWMKSALPSSVMMGMLDPVVTEAWRTKPCTGLLSGDDLSIPGGVKPEHNRETQMNGTSQRIIQRGVLKRYPLPFKGREQYNFSLKIGCILWYLHWNQFDHIIYNLIHLDILFKDNITTTNRVRIFLHHDLIFFLLSLMYVVRLMPLWGSNIYCINLCMKKNTVQAKSLQVM